MGNLFNNRILNYLSVYITFNSCIKMYKHKLKIALHFHLQKLLKKFLKVENKITHTNDCVKGLLF